MHFISQASPTSVMLAVQANTASLGIAGLGSKLNRQGLDSPTWSLTLYASVNCIHHSNPSPLCNVLTDNAIPHSELQTQGRLYTLSSGVTRFDVVHFTA